MLFYDMQTELYIKPISETTCHKIKLKFYFLMNLAGAIETTFPGFHQYGPYVYLMK